MQALQPHPSLRRHWLACVACLGALLVGGCSSKPVDTKGASKRGDGVPVSMTSVAQKDVPLEIDVIGNVEAYSTVSLRAQITGPLQKVHFKEGDFVKKGQLLFTIDPKPFEATLREAEANLARTEAQLKQAEATLTRDRAQARYAQSQAARYRSLFKEGVTSQDQAEQIQANADTVNELTRVDEAAIASARASVVATRAQVETAKINLGYTNIYAPVDGRTGSLALKEGNQIAANTMEIVTINQVQPLYVTFAVPESNLSQVKKYLDVGKLPVTATHQEGGESETGLLTFVDNAVDTSTGTIKLKGTFQNAGRHLWPGEFVRVKLRLTVQQNALVVPSQAIQEGQEGQFVYVVKEDQTVEQRPVQVGPRLAQETMVASGLQAGERVVTDGMLRLAPGMKVIKREPRKGGPRSAGAGPSTAPDASPSAASGAAAGAQAAAAGGAESQAPRGESRKGAGKKGHRPE